MMDKIYRRSTQCINSPKKQKNEKNRVRNTIMNFRVSPKEKELIDARIRLTGLTKSEFFIQSCLYQKILVRGNAKTFAEFEKTLNKLMEMIEVNIDLSKLNPEQVAEFRALAEVIKAYKK